MEEFPTPATEPRGQQSSILPVSMPGQVDVWIGVVTLLIVGTIGISLRMSARRAQVLAPQVDAAMEIRLEASLRIYG